MSTRKPTQSPKKKNFRTWFLGALAMIGAFFAGLFAVRHKDDDAVEPLCTVDIPNLTETQAQALEACYPQAVRLNPREASAR